MTTLLTTAGVALTEPLITAASSKPGAIEEAATTGDALAKVATRIREASIAHHRPGATTQTTLVAATQAWRDAEAIRAQHITRFVESSNRVAADAAMLIGCMIGDGMQSPRQAQPWFRLAQVRAEAGENRHTGQDQVALVGAIWTFVPFGHGDMTGAADAAEAAWGIGSNQAASCSARALAPAQLARIKALRGDESGARLALQTAMGVLSLRDYPDPHGAESVHHYTWTRHWTYADQVNAMIGRVQESREARRQLANTGTPSVMMRTVREFSEAWCRMHEGHPGAAAELAKNTLMLVPAKERSLTVLGRARQLRADLVRVAADSREVRDYSTYLDWLSADVGKTRPAPAPVPPRGRRHGGGRHV